VRHHILGVVGNATHCFVGNFTDFTAVKKFWKSVTAFGHSVESQWHTDNFDYSLDLYITF